MTRARTYTAAWITWLCLTIGSFFAIEVPALIDPAPGDTLTENIRVWLCLSSPDQWLGRVTLALFLGWLTWHFMYPKKPGGKTP